jgi:diguanylate cyclase (GGDEF)-like protein/PAS domain S-box-containing protein
VSEVQEEKAKRPSRRRALTAIAAGALFAAIFALRLAAGDDPDYPILLLAVIPMAMLAIEFGIVGVLVSAAVALAMLVAWVELEGVELSTGNYIERALLFPIIATMFALLAQPLRDAVTAGRRSRSQLLEVISTAHEGFISMDDRGAITAWNPEAEAIFGWTAGEAIGRTVAETIVPQEMRDAHWEGLQRFRETGEGPLMEGRVELEALHRDGHRFPIEITVSAIQEEQGWSFHAFLREITDRKRIEHELRTHVADLDAVIDATRDLARSTDAASARRAICDGTREVSGAEVAILFQPDQGGVGLRATAALGADVEGMMLPFVGEPAGALRAFMTGEPFFLSDIVGHPAVSQSIVEPSGGVSALWQPVLRDHATIGVLTAMWRHRVAAVSARLATVMELLAAEATVAIERADLLGRLENMARTDDLTGLPNRRAWYEELPRELARGRRYKHPVCIAMLDLDRFKEYNDRLGHLAGDRLLKEAAGAWRSALRETDRLARYGGEEFSVVLPDCGLDDAMTLVERLRSVTPEGETCSAGVARWDGRETPEGLVLRADGALYEAKRRGRDRLVVARALSAT